MAASRGGACFDTNNCACAAYGIDGLNMVGTFGNWRGIIPAHWHRPPGIPGWPTFESPGGTSTQRLLRCRKSSSMRGTGLRPHEPSRAGTTAALPHQASPTNSHRHSCGRSPAGVFAVVSLVEFRFHSFIPPELLACPLGIEHSAGASLRRMRMVLRSLGKSSHAAIYGWRLRTKARAACNGWRGGGFRNA